MNEFVLGCNYWDSASGTDMWKKWQPDVVEKDLCALSQCGVEHLRVFPLWRDFQPVKKLYAHGNTFMEYVLGEDEEPIKDNPYALDYTMIERFKTFAQIAKKYNMTLTVSIVTGWMSGRVFVPPAIEGKNLITDPEVLMWTNKFVTGIVKELKGIDNIVMWDLGNECNCMQRIDSRTQAYTWVSLVRNAIAAEDNTRPILSGMHALQAEKGAVWNLEDQGEICDMLTTHPYPSPTVNANVEPMNKMKATIVPTSQSEYYSGISKKPCMIQEQGSFNPCMGNREMAAEFMRANILSAWANNLTGYLWWCGMEHLNLRKAPYCWSMIERELGLVDMDRKPKPVGREMKRLGEVIKKLPKIGPKQIDAVCILPPDENFKKATSTYILAKQAGFNVKIATDASYKASAYIIPYIAFWNGIDIRVIDRVLSRVEKEGADLLISFGGGTITEIERILGVTSNGYRQPLKEHVAKFDFGEIRYRGNRELLLKSVGAEVLAENEDGDVVFSRNKYGKGNVYFLNMPIEHLAYERPEGFDPEITEPYYMVYKTFGKKLAESYVVNTDNPYIGVTQSKNEDGTYIVTAINYSDKPQKLDAIIKDGYSVEVLYGDMDTVDKCEAVVMKVSAK